MAKNVVTLRPNVPGRTENANLAVQHVYAPNDGPVTVYLVVASATEQTLELGIGDTFPIGEDTWTLDRVDGLGTGGNWRVILNKTEP
ncbi:DUF6406 domain-containing protein [Streptomyces sp. NPDC002520]